ncbi:hypothetical protein SAMN05421504_101128 [Amycolatopsis xylanica]|uniref:Uncharacterized protein n=1 Tax=Amycolatopsis xylanica TaxID=589385 RepID=A0A1H2S776_9PSEU|nr:hypothetical protein [Amycolatopsis xylanica]SDW27378.1 hypothetical protein SAMN05421504_101128 [Amycolatopsis xylanica]
MGRHRTAGTSSVRWLRVMPASALVIAWAVLPLPAASDPVTSGPAAPVVEAAPAIALAAPSAPPRTADLTLSSNALSVAPGATGVQTLRVLNGGSAEFAGPVALTYVTPTYLNVDHDKPLPAGCEMRLTDPDPTIPEVVTCRIPGPIAAGKELTVGIPVAATTRVRFVGRVRGMAMAAPTGADADLGDNWNYAQVVITRPTPKLPDGDPVDLYLTNTVPAVSDTQSAKVTLTYGSKAPYEAKGDLQLTYVTPFYINVDHAKPLPSGCKMRLTDRDPLVPEIVVCTMKPLKAGKTGSLAIPVELVKGAPPGPLGGMAAVAPVSDVERGQIDNFLAANVVNITAG